MQLSHYIDFIEIFNTVKKNHLELYPTPESYLEEFEKAENVQEMYNTLFNHPEDSDIISLDALYDSEIINMEDGRRRKRCDRKWK